jgi:predicted alpha/beta-hydrolase family hydrolase
MPPNRLGDEEIPTPVGISRVTWFPARGDTRATLLLGHGTATGVEAGDLQAIARTLPEDGVEVALMTQPYRVERNPRVADETSLDLAWGAVWSHIGRGQVPMIAGGRSAGSQVACRTGKQLGAVGVVALAYPFRGPGSASELTRTGLPTLVVQGTRDPFGVPADFPPLPKEFDLVPVPGADHMFSRGLDQNFAIVTDAVRSWVDRLLTTIG